jgi:hypothetical protein
MTWDRNVGFCCWLVPASLGVCARDPPLASPKAISLGQDAVGGGEPRPCFWDATFPFLSLLPGSRTSQKRQHPLFIQCAGSVPSPCPQSILTSPHIHCDFLFRRALPIEARRRGGRLAKKHKFSGGFFYPTGANNARNQQFSAWRVTR